MDLAIVKAKSNKNVVTLSGQQEDSTIKDVKKSVGANKPKYKDINRQELRKEPKGKALKDEDTLQSLGLKSGDSLYFKDRGLQIGWTTVFLSEYAGPLLTYILFCGQPWLVYGDSAAGAELSHVQKLAAACWVAHYAKRLLETLFVHRFSNATMPVTNLFKNCSYYWGFAAYISYHVNHPLFTNPSDFQVYLFLAGFLLCEAGNFSIHLLLRNLRPAGSKERKIPFPDSNPLTQLFTAVSCPNYTYEVGAWLCFTAMTQCLPVGLFALAGAYQMTMWALGKHRNYRKEFSAYPRRKAIIPFLI